MARKDADKGQKLKAAERRIAVLELKKSGATIRAIQKHLAAQGIRCSISTIQEDLDKAFALLRENELIAVTDLRNLRREQYEALLLAVWPKAVKGFLGANARAESLLDKLVSLDGLDAAKKIEVIDPQKELAKLLGVSPDQLPKPKKNAKS